ncbi:ROK family protein [Streptomyces sp. NPDC017529]|uniref:ROK family protein n=1 Tax=Streptomyces sp. NPDC017529 TaxID=3365000 RepID=UPI0037B9BBF7
MRCIVADVGGTTLRTAVWDGTTGTLSGVRRTPVRGTGGADAADVRQVQRTVLDQLAQEIQAVRAAPEGQGAEAVGIAFAGPVTAAGVVTGAPTVWGGGGPALPLAELLGQRTGLPVTVVNDTTAAAWRYASPGGPSFCLFTVSSGISNKVFHNGEVLVGADGHGGELGHLPCDTSPGAPRCDCGGRGHLGALASGRGILAGARRRAGDLPSAFAASRLAALCDGDPGRLTNEALVQAVRAGDGFATDVLRAGLAHLAHALTSVFLTTGIRSYVFVGGFAQAVGERFTELLAEQLLRVGCFGLTERETRDMLRLGLPDDDHGLVGAGRMLCRAPLAHAVPA